MASEPSLDPAGRTLAALLEKALETGLDALTLRALIEEAAEAGAVRALARLGLEDASARGDVKELRDLLSAWRDAKRSARNAIVTWLVRLAFAGLLLGIAVKLKLLTISR
jgi:hypothetical protein